MKTPDLNTEPPKLHDPESDEIVRLPAPHAKKGIQAFAQDGLNVGGPNAQRDHENHLGLMISEFGCTRADAKRIRDSFYQINSSLFWEEVLAAWDLYTQGVKQDLIVSLGWREPFFPHQELLDMCRAYSKYLNQTISQNPELSHSDWLLAVMCGTAFPPALVPHRALPFAPSSQVWLTSTPDLRGIPQPLGVEMEFPLDPPVAGECLILEAPGQATWAVTVVGPAFSLSEDTRQVRNTLRALDYCGMAWRELPTSNP